jgi:uncharacterized coiled-coil protein SlyX
MPTLASENFNVFVAVEKYFGTGFYLDFEGFTRDGSFHPALFGVWRIFRKHVELSAGMIDFHRMLFDEKGRFSVSLNKPTADAVVRPGIWFGLTFNGNFTRGSDGGFTSLEDRIVSQNETVATLNKEIADLRKQNQKTLQVVEDMQTELQKMQSGNRTDDTHIQEVVLEKLMSLRNVYTTLPFEPQEARKKTNELKGYGKRALPLLKRVLADPTEEKGMRVLAITVLGEIADPDATDILLEVVSRSSDPDIKIESIIALGKMNETRAVPIIEKLVADPDDGVAFAAQEVLQKMVDELGITSSAVRSRPVAMPDSLSLQDRNLETLMPQEQSVPALRDTVSTQ